MAALQKKKGQTFPVNNFFAAREINYNYSKNNSAQIPTQANRISIFISVHSSAGKLESKAAWKCPTD